MSILLGPKNRQNRGMTVHTYETNVIVGWNKHGGSKLWWNLVNIPWIFKVSYIVLTESTVIWPKLVVKLWNYTTKNKHAGRKISGYVAIDLHIISNLD